MWKTRLIVFITILQLSMKEINEDKFKNGSGDKDEKKNLSNSFTFYRFIEIDYYTFNVKKVFNLL